MPELDLSAFTADNDGSPRLRAYVARPRGAGPWPGVVLAHEAYGVDEQMRGHADRLAELGYLTIVPDLYSEGGLVRCVVRVMRALSAGRGRAFTDIAAGRAWLLEQPECTGRIGVVGFCMGGGFAIATAPSFDAAAPHYGVTPYDVHAAVRGACPTVASYGAKDRMVPGGAAKLRAALEEAGVVNDVKEYPEAGHSFMNEAPNGPRSLQLVLRAFGVRRDTGSAADAWRRLDAFFTEHLGDGRA
ncbi:dienelactone hydrolase [Nocardiopsis sp. CNR-923]|uniref:dienelactone hydrolase family protein n=1 Tax=Nocardiopsis sp. CNR-923 TaxID=1904965 RepID=UPI00095C3659|nr:dienelactone hydrolase family protein [Nocardiopsis sp. CNR-923]OLT25912.1 dienelactone hydrolase [Nocardiopsis sp. CNR-923]